VSQSTPSEKAARTRALSLGVLWLTLAAFGRWAHEDYSISAI
jgi:hypothetical protein